jgi:hypothetical protein
MAPNPRFQPATLTVFEVGYNRSRWEYQRAAGTLQIYLSEFRGDYGVDFFDFGYQFRQ